MSSYSGTGLPSYREKRKSYVSDTLERNLNMCRVGPPKSRAGEEALQGTFPLAIVVLKPSTPYAALSPSSILLEPTIYLFCVSLGIRIRE